MAKRPARRKKRTRVIQSSPASEQPRALGPELPVTKAFVVQLSRETASTLHPCAGRIEHLSTGRRVRFEGVEEMLTALTRLLEEVR